MKYKVGDCVLIPRFGNYNPKFDRDKWGKIREVREGRHTSYLIGKTRYLEAVLRDMGGTALFDKNYKGE